MAICVLSLFLFSCQKQNIIQNVGTNLPEGVSNNAVALMQTSSGTDLYSFHGLSKNKTWRDIHNKGFRYHDGQWNEINMPKTSKPVLASTAVTIGRNILLMGGYTVNEKHEEKSVPEIFKLDTVTQKWSHLTNMPVPVDDTVALVFKNMYLYLVSGWHDDDNVSLVQVYDVEEDRWFKATNYPAPAVFGHSGGIVDNKIMICDGVKVDASVKPRQFVSSPVCMIGKINNENPSQIAWQEIPHHSNTAYYRMAAMGDSRNNSIIFVGGSNNPYNFNGIGYNGIASEPSSKIFVYDLSSSQWNETQQQISPNMDHRALVSDGQWYYVIGGMGLNQEVSHEVIKFKVNFNK